MKRVASLLSRRVFGAKEPEVQAPPAVEVPQLHPGRLISSAALVRFPRKDVEYILRERVRPFYMGDHRALCRILGKHKFFVDTRDIGFGANILADGFWEMSLTEFIAKTITPGMSVLDIGANFGYYSILMADLIGPEGKLIAFEPNPHAAGYAEDSLSINNFGARSTVMRAALSDTAGRATFSVPHHEPKNARIVPMGFKGEDSDTIQVPTVTVDEICKHERKVDFIKIDAEGAEHLIWKGMEATLKRDRPRIILEFNADRGDAPAFLQLIRSTYPSLQYLRDDGIPEDVAPERLLSDNVGEDWLLVLQ